MRKSARFFSAILSSLFLFIPECIQIKWAEFLAFLWVDVFKIRKKIVFNNIDIVFNKENNLLSLNDADKYKLMKKSLFFLCKSFFDVLKIPFLSDHWIENHVIFQNSSVVPNETGCFFLTLHLGSGDLAAAAISQKIKPISLITKRFRNSFVDEFWFSLRTKSSTEFIDAHGKQNAFEILKALKIKKGVVFVLDQYMGKPFGLKTTFFNKLTGTAYGLALFAQKTKVPVIPVYTYWDDQMKMKICFCEPIFLNDLFESYESNFKSDHEQNEKLTKNEINILKMNQKDNLNKMITERFNKVIEDIIKKHPEQWMWVHRRWKEFDS